MERLELTDQTCIEIMQWLESSGLSWNYKRNFKCFLKKLQKNFGYISKANLKDILKVVKYQPQKSVLNAINSYCYDNDIDFQIKIPRPRGKKEKKIGTPEVLSEIEIRTLIEKTDPIMSLMIRCIYNMGAGLRVSEIITFKWSNIENWVEWVNDKTIWGNAKVRSKNKVLRDVTIPPEIMNDLFKLAQIRGIINEFGVPEGGQIFWLGEEDYKPELKKENIEEWKNQYIRHAYDIFRYKWNNYCIKILAKRVNVHKLRHCVSEDTKILTVDGWKNCLEINNGDRIYSYNVDKDIIETDNIKEINVCFFDGEAYRIKNGHLDLLCTPEHNSIFNINKTNKEWKGFKINTVDNISKTKGMRMLKHKTSALYNGTDSIGIAKASLLGWILTDGCIRPNGEITISQSFTANPHKCKIIEDILNASNIKYSKRIQTPRKNYFNSNIYQMVIYTILKNTSNGNRTDNIPEHKWIYKYITKDRLPKYTLLNLKQEELLAIYESIMLGDGSRGSELCMQNEHKLEFFRTLCSFIGKTAITNLGQHNMKPKGVMKFRTYITDKADINIILKKHLTKERYVGKMWCPTTNNKTWIAQRNGKIFITGNSRATNLYKDNVPIEQIKDLLGHSSLDTTMIYTKIDKGKILESMKHTKTI